MRYSPGEGDPISDRLAFSSARSARGRGYPGWVGNDDYSQPRALFRPFDADQKKRQFSNVADAMGGMPRFIIEHQLGHFDKVDRKYGDGVRGALAAAGQPLEEPVAGD